MWPPLLFSHLLNLAVLCSSQTHSHLHAGHVHLSFHFIHKNSQGHSIQPTIQYLHLLHSPSCHRHRCHWCCLLKYIRNIWDNFLGMHLTDYRIVLFSFNFFFYSLCFHNRLSLSLSLPHHIIYFKCWLFSQSFDIQSICAVSTTGR